MLGLVLGLAGCALILGGRGLFGAFRGGIAAAYGNDEFLKSKGYNRDRQLELERMALGASDEKRKEFADLVNSCEIPTSPDVDGVWRGWRLRAAIRDIAQKEGWECYEPNYVASISLPNRRR
jgi:hypothetical protein